jgi:hypothetical protein
VILPDGHAFLYRWTNTRYDPDRIQEKVGALQRQGIGHSIMSTTQTREHAIREMVLRRRALYFSDVITGIDVRLSAPLYSVVAAACAERLLTRHLRLPESMRQPHTTIWRYPVDCVWAILTGSGDAANLRSEVASSLQKFYDSPLKQTDSRGEYWPGDPDHDAAATCIYAIESLVQYYPAGRDWALPRGGFLAASRLVDHAFFEADGRILSSSLTGPMSEVVARCCHPIVQHELRWIQKIIVEVDSHPLNDKLVNEIRSQASA